MKHDATIFLVDDNPAELRVLEALLQGACQHIATFSSAAGFLAAYRHQPGCLVLDVVMPDMDGLTLHRKLLDDKIDLPVIFLTAYGNVPMAVKAMQMGAFTFLEKPIQAQTLCKSVREAIEWDAGNRSRGTHRRRAEERLAQLTAGERDVLNLIVAGKLNKEIAAELGLSIRTIEDRRAKLMKKMGVQSLAKLVQLVIAQRN